VPTKLDICRRRTSRSTLSWIENITASPIDLFLRYQLLRSGNVAWRKLLASLPAELDLVLDTEGSLEQYRQLTLRRC
jgi:hypothetical protein